MKNHAHFIGDQVQLVDIVVSAIIVHLGTTAKGLRRILVVEADENSRIAQVVTDDDRFDASLVTDRVHFILWRRLKYHSPPNPLRKKLTFEMFNLYKR